MSSELIAQHVSVMRELQQRERDAIEDSLLASIEDLVKTIFEQEGLEQ